VKKEILREIGRLLNRFCSPDNVAFAINRKYGTNYTGEQVFFLYGQETDEETEVPDLSETTYEVNNNISLVPTDISVLKRKKLEANHLQELAQIVNSESKISLPFRTNSRPLRSSKETATLVIGDVHFGKRTISLETGEEVYNRKIAIRKLEQLRNEFIRIIKLHEVDEAIICLIGDIIDGDIIWDGQFADIETPAFEQLEISKVLWKIGNAVLQACPALKSLRFECVPGNHGRVAPKKTGTAKINNYDNIIYRDLFNMAEIKKEVDSSSKISVAYSSQEPHFYDVKGHRAMIRHKGAAGGTVTSSGKVKIRGWGLIHNCDLAIWGHSHNPQTYESMGTDVIQNGSPCPMDDYAESLGVMNKPTQYIFGTSKEFPTTFVYKIYI